ncbi:MAG: recombinase RecT, partial [Acidimicrobiales bacterium]
VYSEDVFQWVPGEMERPSHRADWFGNRGPAIGAYAYAVLDGNATSKVVVIGPKEIAEAETASDARYEGRPWQKRRDAMIRKTALRRLEPFVPKASEVLAAQRERAVVASEVAAANDLPELPPVGVDTTTAEIVEGEFIDAFPDETAAKP